MTEQRKPCPLCCVKDGETLQVGDHLLPICEPHQQLLKSDVRLMSMQTTSSTSQPISEWLKEQPEKPHTLYLVDMGPYSAYHAHDTVKLLARYGQQVREECADLAYKFAIEGIPGKLADTGSRCDGGSSERMGRAIAAALRGQQEGGKG